MQGHAGVAAVPVPVAPVALQAADRRRDLLDLRLDLLQADHVGLRVADPLEELLVTRADAVDVPGGDFHGGALSPRRATPVLGDGRNRRAEPRTPGSEPASARHDTGGLSDRKSVV